MFVRRFGLLAIAAFLICVFGPGAAFANLKCQCNNGVIEWDMSSDPDDDDAEESCNDACSGAGGGSVWNVDDDDDDGDGDETTVVRPRRVMPRR
jgi:hypothetical protein